jgi:hypothetical protein
MELDSEDGEDSLSIEPAAKRARRGGGDELGRAREAPLVGLRDELSALATRMERPPCKLAVWKSSLKHLLLNGTYVTSYTRINEWRHLLSSAKDLTGLVSAAKKVLATVDRMLAGQLDEDEDDEDDAEDEKG